MHNETPGEDERFILELMNSQDAFKRALGHLAHDIIEACIKAELAGIPRETVMAFIRNWYESRP